jgi:hypothetical protein
MAGSAGGRRATPQEVIQTAARRVQALMEREARIEVRLAVHFSEGEASVFDRGKRTPLSSGTVPTYVKDGVRASAGEVLNYVPPAFDVHFLVGVQRGSGRGR